MDKSFHLLPPSASHFADQLDPLFLFLLAVTAFFTLLIAALVTALAYHYRRRSPDQRTPHVHASHLLEIAWIVIPSGILIVIFGWGAALFIEAERPPANAMQMDVVGKQWMWKVQHPEGPREINSLHVPVGRPIKLMMTSEDVIHSFYIPAFRSHQDVVPGRYTTEWFTATVPGEYHLFCTAYCGKDHSLMIGTVYAMEPGAYQDWLAGAQSDTSVSSAGQTLMAQYGCEACHGKAAPSFTGLFGNQHRKVTADGKATEVVADENYLRESILYPTAKLAEGYENAQPMPSFRGRLSDEQVTQLVSYIKTLAKPGFKTDEFKQIDRLPPGQTLTPSSAYQLENQQR